MEVKRSHPAKTMQQQVTAIVMRQILFLTTRSLFVTAVGYKPTTKKFWIPHQVRNDTGVSDFLRIDPLHHLTKFPADLFELAVVVFGVKLVELFQAALILADPFFCKGAAGYLG